MIVGCNRQLGRHQVGGVASGVGIGIETSHILAAFMGHGVRRGALRDTIEGIVAAVDMVLPAEWHKVILKAFGEREFADGL